MIQNTLKSGLCVLLLSISACMENGKSFVITAKNLSDKNRFVKSATLNGVKYDKAWIEHSDVADGGELLLEMGDKPSQWGATQLPPSGAF